MNVSSSPHCGHCYAQPIPSESDPKPTAVRGRMPTLMRIVALSREQGHTSRAEPRETPHLSRIYLVLIARTTTYRVPVCSGAVLARRACVDPAEEARMQWQTPKLVEIACGCEINAYFPADL
jgi:coenzyme PQQ precursor peptide PqqA